MTHELIGSQLAHNAACSFNERIKKLQHKITLKMTAEANGKPLHATRRFCEMAALTPQKMKRLIASLPPAASLLSAATSQSRWDVSRHAVGANKMTNY
jgi:hypothetical protein